MVAIELLVMALAAGVRATPVADAAAPESTQWTALDIVPDSVNWDGIDMAAYSDPSNWKLDIGNETAVAEGISESSAGEQGGDLDIVARGSACSQGDCPDFNASFDLVYTFTAVPEPPDSSCPGCPPLTIFSSNSAIRVNDCKKCMRKKVGSSLGGSVPGGCYSFKGCGRAQTICVDPGKYRAHRIWKDKNHKTCYRMKVENLGGCGFVKSRIILRPDGTTACNW